MLQYSPKIVTDSLVMCLDASNNKSYPTDLPVKNGLLLWLDAADDTTFSYSSGTVVSQWRDKSGNNFHANQSTTAQQPSRNTINNSRKSVFFNAASRLDYMTISSGISLPTDASIFIIYKPSTQSYQYAVLIDNYHGQGGNYGFVIQRVSTNSQFYYANAGDGTGFIDTSASPWTYTDNVIQLLSLNKASSTGTPYISGTAQTSRSVRAATAQSTTGLTIGYWGYGGGRFYNGDMCEILIFNRSLSSTEMKQVHTYLGQKWGISNTDKSIVDLAGNDDNGLFGNGTVANMPLYDYYNKGTLKFDGSNDYVSVGANAILRGNSISLGVFFKTINNGQSVQFIAGYGDTGVQGYWLGVVGGPIRFFVGNGSTSLQLNSGISPNNDQIYYVVGTYDGVNQKIYVDGVLQNSATTVTGNITYTGMTDGFLIGQVQGFTGGRYLTGNIYAMQIYQKALSAAEVLQNYEAQKSKFANTIVQQGLVLNLDAGNPYSYAGAGTTWYDVSGNGNNATVESSVSFGSAYGGGLTTLNSATNANQKIYGTFSLNNANYTWEIWYTNNGSQGGDPSGFGVTDAGGISSNGFRANSGTSVQQWVGGSIMGQTISTDSTPKQVVLRRSGTTFNSFSNGVLIGTVTAASTSATFVNYSMNHHISTVSNNGWNGTYYIARMYNRTLSDAEVLQNYNATKGRFGL